MSSMFARALHALHIRPCETVDQREILVVEIPKDSLSSFVRRGYVFGITVLAERRESYRQCDVVYDDKLIHRFVFWPVVLWPEDSFHFHGRVWIDAKTHYDWIARRRYR